MEDEEASHFRASRKLRMCLSVNHFVEHYNGIVTTWPCLVVQHFFGPPENWECDFPITIFMN
jgi:hypothetical protein